MNARPDGQSPLLCAQGGGVQTGASLSDNLIREVYEETGLHISVGAPCLVNEFQAPESGFHRVEVFFHYALKNSARMDPDWRDPEGIVTHHVWVDEATLAMLPRKPSSLGNLAFGPPRMLYDRLEMIVR